MAWFGPGDHRQEMLKESAALKATVSTLERAVHHKGGLVEEARVAQATLAARQTELDALKLKLTSLTQRNNALEHESRKVAEENRLTTQDYDLLAAEKNQADRLSVEVSSELGSADMRFSNAQRETKVLQGKRQKYQQDLAVVDEVTSSVEEMQQQIIGLRESLALAKEEEEDIIGQLEDKGLAIAEEEMVHEALISNLASCQQELRALRQRSTLSDQSKAIRHFFTEANALAKRCRHQQQQGEQRSARSPLSQHQRLGTDSHLGSRTDGSTPVTASKRPSKSEHPSRTPPSMTRGEDRGTLQRREEERTNEPSPVKPMKSVVGCREKTIASLEAQLMEYDRQEAEGGVN